MSGDIFHNPKEAAKIIKRSPQTLNNWRSQGRGPAFSKLGRSVVYANTDLLAWVAANKVNNTQQKAGEC
jgi:hypothetical protein